MATVPHAQSPWEFSCDLDMDFGSEENASIAYAALGVDKDVIVRKHEISNALPSFLTSFYITMYLLQLQPDKVKRLMIVSDGKLSVHFEATEARFLRASFSAFVDVLTLATETIEEFGQGMKL